MGLNFADMQEMLDWISKLEHGFKPIEAEALRIFSTRPVAESRYMAIQWIVDKRYQVRSLGVFILGYMASRDPEALTMLREKVSKDSSWQVQEILAKAFDQYCRDVGYEKSLPVISDWLQDSDSNVCRAVTEGLRVWTGRPFFKENPEIAIQLISQHKSHTSEYLRKSVGNALRDISRKHGKLIDKEIANWNLQDKNTRFTYKLVRKNKSLS